MIGVQLTIPQIASKVAKFDPSSLSPTLWFDASDGSTSYQERTGASATTLSGSGGPIGSWLNKGSLGGWATAPSDAARAILTDDGSGRLYALADGVDDRIDFASTANCSANMTICIAVNRTSAGIDQYFMGPSGASFPEVDWFSDNKIYCNFHDNVSNEFGSSLAYSSTGPHVITCILNSVSGGVTRLNGVQVGSTVVTLYAGGFSRLFGYAGVCRQAAIYQALIFNSALSGSSLAKLETWAGSKCGVSL